MENFIFVQWCELAPQRLSTNCKYGAKFDLQHILPSKKGGFISIRHNQIPNITARLLKEVWKDIRVEPQLQQLTGETLQSSTLTGNEVCLDICVGGLWQTGQIA